MNYTDILIILWIVALLFYGIDSGKILKTKTNNMSTDQVQIIIKVKGGKCPKTFHKKFKWKVRLISFLFTHLKTKGDISMTSAKVDQTFLASWPAPKDKYGNPAKVQEGSIAFVSDFPEFADIAPATAEEIAAYNESAADDAKIPDDAIPYTAKVTTRKDVGSTMVRIKADGNLDPAETAVSTLEGILTVEVLAGDAVAFAEAKVTTPSDNTDTPE